MKIEQWEEICRLMLQLVQRSSDRSDHIMFKASGSTVALKEEVVENEVTSANDGVRSCAAL